MVGASGEYGLEAGAKMDYLLAYPGFIPMLNNAVFIEGEVFVASEHIFVAPLLRWDFNLHPQWTVYGESGIEANIRTGGSNDGGNQGARLDFGAGAIWRLPSKEFFLRGEVDIAHGAVRVGPMFAF